MAYIKAAWLEIYRRGRNVIICVDQLVGSLISLGDAYPDETPSSYAYRLEKNGRFFGELFRPLIDMVFLLCLRERNHCQKSYLNELRRSDSSKEFACAEPLPVLFNGSVDSEYVDSEIPSDFGCPDTEPSEWGALATDPKRKLP